MEAGSGTMLEAIATASAGCVDDSDKRVAMELARRGNSRCIRDEVRVYGLAKYDASISATE